VRRTQMIAFSIVLVAIVIVQPSGFASDPQTVQWLQTSGFNIYDESGQTFDLHGVNLTYGAGQPLTPADIQAVKALGFNSIRVNNVYWGLIQPYNESSQGIDVQYLVTGISTPLRGVHPPIPPLDYVVNLAVQQNVYVVICLYAWTGYYPPPQWAFPAISHSGNNQVWMDGGAASLRAYSGVFNGTAAKERTGLINTWRFIADRYKDIPNVVFELLNEPLVPDASLAGNYYKTFNEQVISAIESVETRSHLKLIPLLRNAVEEEITGQSVDVSKSNVVWVSHIYAPMNNWDPNGNYWHDSFTWHGKYLPKGYGNGTTFVAWKLVSVAAKIHSWNRPWMNTEFAKQVTQTYWKSWFKIVMDTMTEQQIAGWQYYSYSLDPSKDAGWNIKDPSTQAQVIPVLQDYLGQLHPMRR